MSLHWSCIEHERNLHSPWTEHACSVDRAGMEREWSLHGAVMKCVQSKHERCTERSKKQKFIILMMAKKIIFFAFKQAINYSYFFNVSTHCHWTCCTPRVSSWPEWRQGWTPSTVRWDILTAPPPAWGQMKEADKALTGMEKWCGLCVCPWNRSSRQTGMCHTAPGSLQ